MGMPEATERLLTLLFAGAATVVGFVALVHQIMGRRSDQRARLYIAPNPYEHGDSPGEGLWINLISHGQEPYADIHGTIQNQGQHAARNARLSVFHGDKSLEVSNRPQSNIHPDQFPDFFDFSLPFHAGPTGPSADDLVTATPLWNPVRVEVAYTDGDSSTVPFSRCFVFRRDEALGAVVSKRILCPIESFAVVSGSRSDRVPSPERGAS